jgi:hypothetical protein
VKLPTVLVEQTFQSLLVVVFRLWNDPRYEIVVNVGYRNKGKLMWWLRSWYVLQSIVTRVAHKVMQHIYFSGPILLTKNIILRAAACKCPAFIHVVAGFPDRLWRSSEVTKWRMEWFVFKSRELQRLYRIWGSVSGGFVHIYMWQKCLFNATMRGHHKASVVWCFIHLTRIWLRPLPSFRLLKNVIRRKKFQDDKEVISKVKVCRVVPRRHADTHFGGVRSWI